MDPHAQRRKQLGYAYRVLDRTLCMIKESPSAVRSLPCHDNMLETFLREVPGGRDVFSACGFVQQGDRLELPAGTDPNLLACCLRRLSWLLGGKGHRGDSDEAGRQPARGSLCSRCSRNVWEPESELDGRPAPAPRKFCCRQCPGFVFCASCYLKHELFGLSDSSRSFHPTTHTFDEVTDPSNPTSPHPPSSGATRGVFWDC